MLWLDVFRRIDEWLRSIGNDFILTVAFFSSKNMAKLPRFWNCLRAGLHQPWKGEVLWLHPRADRWAECVPKVSVDEARGVAVMPTRKEHGWWLAMGEVALDWGNIPVGSPLLADSQGEILHTREPMLLVLFDAFGHKDGQDNVPEDTDTQRQNKQKADSMDDWDLPPESNPGKPSFSKQNPPPDYHPTLMMDRAESDRSADSYSIQGMVSEFCYSSDSSLSSQKDLQRVPRQMKRPWIRTKQRSQTTRSEVDSGTEDTPGPSDISVCSEPESVNNDSTEQTAVLHTRKCRRRQPYYSEFKHRVGSGKREKRGVQVVGDTQQGLDNYQTGSLHQQSSRSINSVIQADEDWPEGEYYRQKIMQDFAKTVFTTKHVDKIDAAAQAARGQHAKVQLKLLQEHSGLRAAKPIRAVGLREQVLLEKLGDFRKRGMLRKAEGDPQWVSCCFLVPKPGTNQWRLVIDYRYLNSCLEGKIFPLPIIEDQLTNQQGNFIFFADGFGGRVPPNAS